VTSPTSYTSSTASTSMISGLVSGMDTSSIISQLMQIEAQPQNLLKTQLSQTQDQAAAYRQINTAMASLSSAAQAITDGGLTSARKASSSSSFVAASADSTAVAGSSLTFSVTQLASAQTSLSAGTWSSATTDVRTSAATGSSTLPDWPLSVVVGGKTLGTIDVPAGGSLNDAAAAINSSGYGLSATVVQLDSSHFKLQVSSTSTGGAAAFSLQSASDPTGTAFSVTTTAQDAKLDLGNGNTASSSSNTFNNLLTGVSVTVSQVSPADPADATKKIQTSISVANDTSAATGLVKALVDAANAALKSISDNTDSSDGSTAVLKGNWTLTNLAGQILSQVSGAVDGVASKAAQMTGGASPKMAGIELTKDGTISFDASTFSSLLASNAALATQIVGGVTGAGADNVNHSPDDTIDVDGLASRLSVLAEQASDSATGMITSLANSQDTRAKDIQSQIDDWTLRLQMRQQTLTDQFNAMETALGTLKSQSSWLSSQISSLYNPNASKS
jgi:flagellar capping protein FliD